MKMEDSPTEFGAAASEAFSGEGQCGDEHSSDDEPETEIEALHKLAPEERRKALRRLRNRQSARRVRARRAADFSQMEVIMAGVRDENVGLKKHVSKLQNHIQSMTLKVYEVTAKYEAAVAENAQLCNELQRPRRTSTLGDSSFVAPAATTGTLAGTAGEPEVSPFVALCPAPAGRCDSGAAGQLGLLSSGHAQLRSSSPVNVQQQKHALDEVVMLLQAHKRRTQVAVQDHSGVTEIASNAPGNKQSFLNAKSHSPGMDVLAHGVVPMLGNAAFGGGGGGGNSVSRLTYNGSGNMQGNGNANNASHLLFSGSSGAMGQYLHLPPTSLDSGGLPGSCSATQPGTLLCHMQQQQQEQLQYAAAQGTDGGAEMRHASLSASTNRSHLLPLGQVQQQMMMTNQGPGASFSMLAHQQNQAQQQQIQQQQAQQWHAQQHQAQQDQAQQHQALLLQQAAMQGHSLSLMQMQQAQQFQQQQQHHQAGAAHALQGSCLQPGGPGVLYSGLSAVSSTCFYSASSVLQGSGGQLQGGAGLGQAAGAGGSAGGVGSLHGGLHSLRSAPMTLLGHGDGGATGSNLVSMHSPAWMCGAAGVAQLRPEDISEDMFMSLDECMPRFGSQ